MTARVNFSDWIISKKAAGPHWADQQNARIEHDRALDRVMMDLMADFTELFKQYSDNPAFKRWLSDRNFEQTYSGAGA